MSHRKLGTTLVSLGKSLSQNTQLAAAAEQWVKVTPTRNIPKFTETHKDIVVEMAFLQAFISWETFLEETFILYLMGKKAPKGRLPRRYVFPPSRKFAAEFIVRGRRFADWTVASTVIERAKRFFHNGEPYITVLRSDLHKFKEMKTIRNAIVHSSVNSQEQFKKLVRDKIGTIPPRLTIGGFLNATVVGSSPPQSYLELYLGYIFFAAQRIVPC